jgi:hypothetical protein
MLAQIILPLLVFLVVGGTLIAMYARAREQRRERTAFFRFEFVRLGLAVAVAGAAAFYGLWKGLVALLFQ